MMFNGFNQKLYLLVGCISISVVLYFEVLQEISKYGTDTFDARKIDLLNAMSESLGLNKNIKFSDIKRFYYPQGLADINDFHYEKNQKELEYYNCMINSLKSNVQRM